MQKRQKILSFFVKQNLGLVAFLKGFSCQRRHMLQRITYNTLCGISALLSVHWGKMPLWRGGEASCGPGTTISVNQQGEGSDLQIQEHHGRAQPH